METMTVDTNWSAEKQSYNDEHFALIISLINNIIFGIFYYLSMKYYEIWTVALTIISYDSL